MPAPSAGPGAAGTGGLGHWRGAGGLDSRVPEEEEDLSWTPGSEGAGVGGALDSQVGGRRAWDVQPSPEHTRLLNARGSAPPRPPPVNPAPCGRRGTVARSPQSEQVRDPHAPGSGMETDEPESPREPPSPPPPPSPPSPAPPASPGSPRPEQQPSEAYARQLLLEEWRPPGGSLQLPPRLTWQLLFLRRPLYRNLLRSPNPEGA